MEFEATSLEVKRTAETSNGESVYSLVANIKSKIAIFQLVILFTRSGRILFKNGRPIVRFQNFDSSCDHVYTPGKTNYQARLYNQIIERSEPIVASLIKYLVRSEFIDNNSLKKRNPRMYQAIVEAKELISSN